MSDRYLFNFCFGLDPYLPDGVLRTFQALSQGQRPDPLDLEQVPHPLRDFLRSPDLLRGGADHEACEAPVRIVHVAGFPETPYSAQAPEWELSFSVSVHDDWYANGAYVLSPAMLAIVGGNGLFCTETTEGQGDTVTLHYREDDDHLIVRIGAPFSVSRLPPTTDVAAAEARSGWTPATQGDFSVDSFTRLTPAMREQMFHEVEEMYREAGWVDPDSGSTGGGPDDPSRS